MHNDPKKVQRLVELLSISTPRTADQYREAAELSTDNNSYAEASAKWTDYDRAELDVLLAEYESLRQESLNTITNRTQVMLLGLAAVAALVGGSFTIADLTKNSLIVFAVFSFSIPLVCIFVFLVWLSEAVRSHRVGHFIASAVEARINAKLGRLVMTWEAVLWTGILPRDELFGPSMIALVVPGLIAVGAPIFGLFLTRTKVSLHGRPLYELLVPALLLLSVGGYALAHMGQLRNTRSVISSLHSRPSEQRSLKGRLAEWRQHWRAFLRPNRGVLRHDPVVVTSSPEPKMQGPDEPILPPQN